MGRSLFFYIYFMWEAVLKTKRVFWGILASIILCHASLALAGSEPKRILSMSPAGTEVLFALGLGDRVVGITKYCDYPPEAMTIPRLSTMTEVSLETLLREAVDLVVMEDINSGLELQIEKLGLPVLVMRHSSIEELIASAEALGYACGVGERAYAFRQTLQKQTDVLRVSIAALPRPRVLVVVDQDISDAVIRSIYVAGKRSFYDELIEIAGGVNALTEDLSYVRLSSEGILTLQPDVIINIVGEHGLGKGDRKSVV